MQRILPGGIEITDAEYALLRYQLVNVDDWLTGALMGKIGNAYHHLRIEWDARFAADPSITSMPVDFTAYVNAVLAHPDYLDRKQSDALQEARRAEEA